ncbi:hypothetical protein FB446DRAFT_791608 [Lentinula raphanica]|nr:hypothetical protein FB446DRAFT_791608 [Lentinula raphanica]
MSDVQFELKVMAAWVRMAKTLDQVKWDLDYPYRSNDQLNQVEDSFMGLWVNGGPPLDLVPPPSPSFPRLLTPTWLVETRIAGARDSSRVHTCLRYTQTGYVLVMLAMMYAFGLS